MSKNYRFLPFLMLLFFTFSSCQFSTTNTVHGETIPPEYQVSKTEFEKEISAITQFDEILVSTSVTTKNGVRDNSISIELKNPETSLEDRVTFLLQSNKIISKAKESIKNIEDYDKIVVNYSEERMDDGIEKKVSFKTERDL